MSEGLGMGFQIKKKIKLKRDYFSHFIFEDYFVIKKIYKKI